MKSNSISEVLSTAMLAQEIENAAQVEQPEQSFDAMLGSQTEAGADGTVMEVLPSGSAGDIQQTYEREKSEAAYREIAKADDSQAQEQVSAVEENQDELEDKVKELLSEELGITREELEDVMETLGITLDSLINGTGLKDLMMEFTGAEDMTELLMNDTFSDLMQKLEVLVQEFSQQLGMSSEEFKAAMQQLENVSTDTDVLAEAMADNQTDEVVSLETTVTEHADEMQTEVTSTVSQGEAVMQTEEAAESGSQAETNAGQTEHAGEALVQDESAGSQHQVTYQEVQTTVNAVGEQITQVVEQTFVDAEDIMRQITELTKITVQQAQSSIEMQLNPEHLGKIYLQVVSKGGMITAQLAVENEAVKQAVENQLAVLRENMNQQGLKVEAVEVTIASHEFEQNLEGNQQSAQEDAKQEAGKTRRFLTADNLDELSGLMTEEESLVAQIMLDNGNSMDVTA